MSTTENCYQGAIANAWNTPTVNSTFTCIPLNDVANWSAPGTSGAQNFRIGQEYFLSRFNIKFCIGNIVQTTGAAIVPLYFRYIIIEAKDLQGTATPVTTTAMWRTVFDQNNTFSGISATNQALWNKIDWKYYRTLIDRKVVVGRDGNGQDIKNVEFSLPINKKIKTNAQAEGANEQSKRYFLIFFAYDPRYPTGGTHLLNYEWQAIWKDV